MHAYQSDPDGAFFEDWSEWLDLGTPPKGKKCPVGYRPYSGARPSYHCLFRPSIREIDGRPGFEVALPQHSIADLVRRIPGTRESVMRIYSANCRLYIVPAEQWQALRAVLPKVKETITRMTKDWH